MKNQSFYLCLLVLLLSFMARMDGYSQDNCMLGPLNDCVDVPPITLTTKGGVIAVNDAFVLEELSELAPGLDPADAHVQLHIPQEIIRPLRLRVLIIVELQLR